MITLTQVVEEVRGVSADELRQWMEAEWIAPADEAEEYLFSEMEVARIRLIRDMMRDMRIEAETLPIILSLLDQVYDLRHCLRCLTAAVHEQPEEVQENIRRTVRSLMGEGEI